MWPGGTLWPFYCQPEKSEPGPPCHDSGGGRRRRRGQGDTLGIRSLQRGAHSVSQPGCISLGGDLVGGRQR